MLKAKINFLQLNRVFNYSKKGFAMDFDTFKKMRNDVVAWNTANGFNISDSRENGEFSLLKALKDHYDLFVDVGANNGIFIDYLYALTVKSSDKPPFVLAFEPNPKLQEILAKKIDKGVLVQSALSNHHGSTTFNIYSDDDTTSSLFDRTDYMPHFTKKVTQIKVKLDTLDSHITLLQQKSTKAVFLKIDAEGVELPIIQGAELLFKSCPLIFLMFEYSKAWKMGNHTVKDAFHLLDNSGFKIFRLTPMGLESMRFYTPEMEGPDYCNYFAIKGFDIGEIFSKNSIRSTTHNWNDFFLFP